jgi:hypothetical protein
MSMLLLCDLRQTPERYLIPHRNLLHLWCICGAICSQVAEHAAWLTTNCSNQLDYYASYLKQHRLPGSSSKQQQQQAASSSSSSSNGSSPPETAGSGSSALASMDVAAAVSAASSSRSLAAVADFKPDAARMLLEEELREAFLGTAGSAAGAQTLFLQCI